MAATEIGVLQVPKDLLDIILKHKSNTDEKPDNYTTEEYNDQSYLDSFKRKIDIPILCFYYGLYKSRELPPELNTDISFGYNFEFGADISKHSELFNNLLFALWVKKNPVPKEYSLLIKYREQLYLFLEKLQNNRYFTKILIPFYLQKASDSNNEQSFINRLKNSDYVKYEPIDSSPEYLAMEFYNIQKEFMEYLIIEEVEKTAISLDIDKIPDMKETELINQLDKRVDVIEIRLREVVKSKLLDFDPNYWSKVTNPSLKGNVEERKKLKLGSNPMIKESDIDIFDFFTFMNIKQIISEFWTVFEPVFRSKSDMKEKFEDLSELRNALKHNQKLIPYEIEKGKLILMWFEDTLKNY